MWLSACASVGMCCSDTHNAHCVLSPRRSVISLCLMRYRRPVPASHFHPSLYLISPPPATSLRTGHKFCTIRRRFPQHRKSSRKTLILPRQLPEGGHHFSLWERPRDSASHSSARKMRRSPLLPRVQLSARPIITNPALLSRALIDNLSGGVAVC